MYFCASGTSEMLVYLYINYWFVVVSIVVTFMCGDLLMLIEEIIWEEAKAAEAVGSKLFCLTQQ